jgi:uncharacterized protein (TIGR02145 family)
MKKFCTIGLIILSLIISQQAYPQKENAKNPLTGEQEIELSAGFSFISTRIIPEDPDMLAVMASVLNENLDFIRNSQGQTLRKIGPNWVNNIGDWIIEEGYLVKMFADDSFLIEGDAVDPVSPISLTTGFQFVSYFPDIQINALTAFETILGDDLDFIRNSQGQTLHKIGPNWVNGIGVCNPGEGYLVKLLNNDVLIYPITYGEPCPGIPTVTYEGQVYNTVLIGDQCWFKENLNVGTMINGNENMSDDGVIEKYCYDNDTANCEIYGGLYQWNEIMEYTITPGMQGICPAGWHLPTDDEWKILEGTVDSQYPVGDPIWNQIEWRGYDAGLNLKSLNSWFIGGNGSGLYNYEALPGGYRDPDGYIYLFTDFGYFWSSSEGYSSYAWMRGLGCSWGGVHRTDYGKEYGLSVRCLKD